jgi:hypothetical protein
MRDVSGMDRYSKFEKQIRIEKRMYEENHYCVFDMNHRAVRAPAGRPHPACTANSPTRMERGFPAIFARRFNDDARVDRKRITHSAY